MSQLFRRILVPHDFSDHAMRALEIAIELAAENRGSLVVLHAIPPFAPIGGLAMGEVPIWIPPDDLVAAERKRLEAIVKRTIGKRAVTSECWVLVGDPYQQIIAAARTMDLIVMSTAGRTGLAHLEIGSVAEKVVRHSPVPVLTVRPETGKHEKIAPLRGARKPTSRGRAASGK